MYIFYQYFFLVAYKSDHVGDAYFMNKCVSVSQKP